MSSRFRWRVALDWAGSRQLTVFLLVAATLYAFVLVAFGLLVEERWLDIIGGLYPYRFLYAIFALNLIACGVAWSPIVWQRCRRLDPPGPGAATGRLEHAIDIPDAGLRLEDFMRELRRRGFALGVADRSAHAPAGRGATNVFTASKGTFSLFGNLLFHGGFLLLLAGAVTNALYRFEGTAVLAEGAAFTGKPAEYRRVVDSRAGTYPEVDFDVERIAAEFWENRLFFTGLEARLVHRGGRTTARLSEPARVGSAEVSITGFGYVPVVELRDRKDEILARAQVKVNVFPPGAEDYFQVPGYPHRIFVAFYPDHAVVDGKHVSRSMKPDNPAWFLRILRGRFAVYTGLVKSGEVAEYDGLRIAFPSVVRSGDFRIVRNPGHPLVWTAFAAMWLGLAWRLFLYRRDVALWQESDGRMRIVGRFDYFPRTNGAWLERLVEMHRKKPA